MNRCSAACFIFFKYNRFGCDTKLHSDYTGIYIYRKQNDYRSKTIKIIIQFLVKYFIKLLITLQTNLFLITQFNFESFGSRIINKIKRGIFRHLKVIVCLNLVFAAINHNALSIFVRTLTF